MLLLAAILLIVLNVLGQGYLPPDAALMHAAKVVSGRSWHEILVLSDPAWLDPWPGWHALLELVHRTVGGGPDTLVVFAVVGLFVALSLAPLCLMKRPEAWILALLVVLAANPHWLEHVLRGAPHIASMAVLLTILFLWPQFERPARPGWHVFALVSGLTAVQTTLHANWCLPALPLLALVMARKWRGARRLAITMGSGVLAGGCLAGQPRGFLTQSFLEPLRSGLQPGGPLLPTAALHAQTPDFRIAACVLALLAWGAFTKKRRDVPLARDPVFLLACLCWVLAQLVPMLWLNWGMPVAALWIACQLQTWLEQRIPTYAHARLALTLGAGAILCLATTANTQNRWTARLKHQHLKKNNPLHAKSLPENGGILYSDARSVFYRTFYANPAGDWRYLLGPQRAPITQELRATLARIRRARGSPASYAPWIAKMNPEDRLVLMRPFALKPDIHRLQWLYPASGTWVGRLPSPQPNRVSTNLPAHNRP